MSAVYHGDAEEEEAWEEVDEEEAKQEAAPGEEAIRHLAPWDPEPATPHTQEDQLIQDQLIHIREHLRRAGLSMAAYSGNSGAGELLLDMVGDLVQEICLVQHCQLYMSRCTCIAWTYSSSIIYVSLLLHRS